MRYGIDINPVPEPNDPHCIFCKKLLLPSQIRRHRLYCSTNCQKRNRPKTINTIYRHQDVTRSSLGAVSELEVCADLIKRGMDVFRALSPHCDCDLIALKNRRTIRIEVTTGHISNCGTVHYAKHNPDKFDVLAVFSPNGISYLPPIDKWFSESTPL